MSESFVFPFAAKPIADSSDPLAVASLAYSTQLSAQKLDGEVKDLHEDKASRCELRHVHGLAMAANNAASQATVGAIAGVGALTATQLFGCADQTAALQEQALNGDLQNAIAASVGGALTNQQIQAFLGRFLNIKTVQDAGKAGIAAATAAQTSQIQWMFGYGCFGGPGVYPGAAPGYGPGYGPGVPGAGCVGGVCR